MERARFKSFIISVMAVASIAAPIASSQAVEAEAAGLTGIAYNSSMAGAGARPAADNQLQRVENVALIEDLLQKSHQSTKIREFTEKVHGELGEFLGVQVEVNTSNPAYLFQAGDKYLLVQDMQDSAGHGEAARLFSVWSAHTKELVERYGPTMTWHQDGRQLMVAPQMGREELALQILETGRSRQTRGKGSWEEKWKAVTKGAKTVWDWATGVNTADDIRRKASE